ncbi:glycine--tRNA ligase subunit beta [Sphingomonas sp. BGYR3]|uniref:glycine--tRNA ligase subunit beta n=1 Tax=Sphingomonas sp. BGYR3 TaxID=2975483 RepID=UPI0021A86C90|nr:glycine--tRNA ligase subunit beta [Sphingomonas sp. BGYR3]
MTDFLLELRSEEIPARMQDRARADLEKLFVAELEKAGLKAGGIVTYATPRRLTLIARDLPEATAALSEELKGPPADAPDAAVEGFLRKAGLTRDALETRDVKGRATLFAVIERAGRPTADLLAEAIPAIVRAFPWPKSMRWGAASVSTESLRWVRPLQGIVALFGDAVVDCEVAGIRSGRETMGHRFHHDGVVTIGSAQDYAEALRAAHVIVDQDERRAMIRARAAELASEAGLTLIEDEGLVAENAGLTEWPVPLIGRFDPAFLDVPPEVIQLTARVNQKYFVCADTDGKLANAFVCTANITASDGGAKIVEGNQKVLAARLSDARFFYDTDLKVPLEKQAEKLAKIVFHEKLGTVADKVDRVAKLARWLCEEGIVRPSPLPFRGGAGGGGVPQAGSPVGRPHPNPSPEGEGLSQEQLADLAERAARLCKADLVTGMVGEFPELQGLMGGYYAAAQGEHPAVAAAIRDHYKPVGQGDDVPTDPVTVAVSLADKLDTLMCFFAIGEKPTGSKDPFALRRAALSVIRSVLANNIRFSLDDSLETMTDVIASGRTDGERQARRDELDGILLNEIATGDAGLVWFFADRLKVQQREAGVRHDLIDAVFALGGEDDLVRLLARVHALQAFMGTEDGANLLAGYKRAANILKKEGGVPEGAGTNPSPAPAEAALIAALDAAEPLAAAAVAEERFGDAMAALASLRAPIDTFFTDVIVNDPDPAIRAARLALLARMRDAVHAVADFSRIEG